MNQHERFAQAKRGVEPPPLPGRRVEPPPLPGVHRAVTTRPVLATAGAVRRSGILNPAELDPLKNLLLFAQSVVEGWLSGKHRSLDFGSNAEFAEHRAYVAGDPVSQVDWRVYARNRRLVVRRQREEKEMTGYLVVDVSGSMAYKGSGLEPKRLRAVRVAAALAYLMQRQGDKSAMALFNQSLVWAVPAGSTRRHLHDLVAALETAGAQTGGLTRADAALDLCVPLFKRRGSLIIISDFFTDLDRFFDAVAQFQHRRFKILLLHVIDPDERHLPNVPLARFVDMETAAELQVAPDEVRDAYEREMEAMTRRLQDESMRRGLEYRVLSTEAPYTEALEAWIGLRRVAPTTRRA
ncbi:MAG: DUF58 domain-containing protein [Verrucomicrobiales bacterium]